MVHEFCSGKHECLICFIEYECEGVGYGHDNSKEAQCHGTYHQFCGNHPLNEYIEKHEEYNEI